MHTDRSQISPEADANLPAPLRQTSACGWPGCTNRTFECFIDKSDGDLVDLAMGGEVIFMHPCMFHWGLSIQNKHCGMKTALSLLHC